MRTNQEQSSPDIAKPGVVVNVACLKKAQRTGYFDCNKLITVPRFFHR
jgi:hypothetical protein